MTINFISHSYFFCKTRVFFFEASCSSSSTSSSRSPCVLFLHPHRSRSSLPCVFFIHTEAVAAHSILSLHSCSSSSSRSPCVVLSLHSCSCSTPCILSLHSHSSNSPILIFIFYRVSTGFCLHSHSNVLPWVLASFIEQQGTSCILFIHTAAATVAVAYPVFSCAVLIHTALTYSVFCVFSHTAASHPLFYIFILAAAAAGHSVFCIFIHTATAAYPGSLSSFTQQRLTLCSVSSFTQQQHLTPYSLSCFISLFFFSHLTFYQAAHTRVFINHLLS